MDINVEYTENGRFTKSTAAGHIDLENWMGGLPHHLCTVPLISLAIPGSHNSFSYSISPHSCVSPDAPNFVQFLSKYGGLIARKVICNWSKGQNCDITCQLRGGIRYLDIRLVAKDSNLYVAHGLYGSEIQHLLNEVNDFLLQHQREIVVLDFQHLLRFNLEDHYNLLASLDSAFGSRMCQRLDSIRSVTLQQMWNTGAQVLVIYRSAVIPKSPFLWPSHYWSTPWPNKINVTDLLVTLDQGISNRRQDVGYVTQCVLTPTITYVFLRLCSSLQSLAYNCNSKIIPWLETKTFRNGLNVVICDFIQDYQFTQRVIGLNYKVPNRPTDLPLRTTQSSSSTLVD